MTSFVPIRSPRSIRRRGSVTAHLKKSLLSARQIASTFEFAYQGRIAVERIRFAIRQTDQLAAKQPVLQEVGMQLMDALDRLEIAERHFQKLFRHGVCSLERVKSVENGTREIGRHNSQME